MTPTDSTRRCQTRDADYLFRHHEPVPGGQRPDPFTLPAWRQAPDRPAVQALDPHGVQAVWAVDGVYFDLGGDRLATWPSQPGQTA